MVSDFFVVNQAAQTYDIYLICQRTYIKSTKIPGIYTFFEIIGILLEIPSISNSRCKKPGISNFLIRNAQYFDRNPRFFIKILGILFRKYQFQLGNCVMDLFCVICLACLMKHPNDVDNKNIKMQCLFHIFKFLSFLILSQRSIQKSVQKRDGYLVLAQM